MNDKPSTAPWDQLKRGTTITIWDGEPSAESRGYTVHHSTPTSRMLNGARQGGTILLVSHPNPDYRPN